MNRARKLFMLSRNQVKKTSIIGGVDQLAACLPSVQETFRSIPSTTEVVVHISNLIKCPLESEPKTQDCTVNKYQEEGPSVTILAFSTSDSEQ